MHIARGIVLFELKRNDDAMHSFDRAIQLDGSADPYFQRARIRAEMKDTKGAIEDLNTALNIEPNNLWAFAHAGPRLSAEGRRLESAKEDIDLALKSRPGDAQALVLRAAIFAKEKKYDEAIKDLEELAKIAPKNPELMLQLGLFYAADKQSHKAIEKFNVALEADGKNETAYALRGSAYLNLGKHAEAIRDYEQAVKLKPDDSEVQNNFAWVLSTSPEEKLLRTWQIQRKDRTGQTSLRRDRAYKAEAYILSTSRRGVRRDGRLRDRHQMVYEGRRQTREQRRIKTNLQKKNSKATCWVNKKPWRELKDEDAENAKLKDSKAPTAENTAQKPDGAASNTQTK